MRSIFNEKFVKKMIFVDPYTVYGWKSTFAAEKKKAWNANVDADPNRTIAYYNHNFFPLKTWEFKELDKFDYQFTCLRPIQMDIMVTWMHSDYVP